MPNCCSSKIGWHFRKAIVKFKPSMILFCFMYEMFSFTKAFLYISNLRKFIPTFLIYLNQVGNRLPENIQRMADWYILFFNLYTITRYNLQHNKVLHLVSLTSEGFYFLAYYIIPLFLASRLSSVQPSLKFSDFKHFKISSSLNLLR